MSDEEKEHPKDPEAEWENPAAFGRQIQQSIFRAMGEIGRELSEATRGEWPFAQPSFSPRVEVIEEDERIRVLADLPGVHEDDLDIELEADYLLLRGERRPPEVAEGQKVRANYGKFRRRIALPAEVEATQVDATLANGVLTVVLQKKKSPRVKVKVTRG